MFVILLLSCTAYIETANAPTPHYKDFGGHCLVIPYPLWPGQDENIEGELAGYMSAFADPEEGDFATFRDEGTCLAAAEIIRQDFEYRKRSTQAASQTGGNISIYASYNFPSPHMRTQDGKDVIFTKEVFCARHDWERYDLDEIGTAKILFE